MSSAERQRRYKERHPERVAAMDRAYSLTGKGKEVRRRARKAWQERNPEADRQQRRAGGAVIYALQTGRLVRGPCAICGLYPTQAHHPNGHEKAHYLDVTWLCIVHHRIAHGKPVIFALRSRWS